MRGTLPGQRAVRATLGTIAAAAADAGIGAPAVTVVGPVAALHDELDWLARPARWRGVSVAVTRARAQAGTLAAPLRALGAEVVETPAIRIEPLAAELPDVAAYDLLCVTSPNGAELLLAAVRDARALAGPRIAAIGPGTARALRAGGVSPTSCPDARSPSRSSRRWRTCRCRARSSCAPRRRATCCPRRCARAAPRSTCSRSTARSRAAGRRRPRGRAGGADYLTFASASAARFFHEAAGSLDGPRLVSIGPVTSAELRRLGAEPDVEASEHTPDGLVAALVRGRGSAV